MHELPLVIPLLVTQKRDYKFIFYELISILTSSERKLGSELHTYFAESDSNFCYCYYTGGRGFPQPIGS